MITPEADPSAPPKPAGTGKSARKREALRFFFRNGPLAIFASSLPGFVNYFIILYLTYRATAAEVGDYRLLLSYFVLTGLISVQEACKIFVRSTVLADRETYASIFLLRLWTTLAGVALGFGAIALAPRFGWDAPNGLTVVLALAALFYPFDLFNPYLQAKGRFFAMATTAAVKYAGALGAFLAALWLGASVVDATLIHLATLALFHVGLFLLWLGRDVFAALRERFAPVDRLRGGATRESIVLSLANLLPSSLEHVDKIMIGAVFGLHALGVYTLGFSTGRFLYNALKPALYIYYGKFVDRMPSARTLWSVTIAFSALGALMSGAFLLAVEHAPALGKFADTRAVTVILFASYGVAMADALYTQAYAINKATNSNHILTANVLSGIVCLAMFFAASRLDAASAMIVCALHYPVRHAVTLALIGAFRRREQRRVEKPGAH